MKRLILTLTGVFALVSGAFAQIVQTPITSLPVVLNQPGFYYLTPQAVTQAGPQTDPSVPGNFQNFAIVINGSGITLDLRDQSVNCLNGIAIINGSPSNSNVTVESTPNGAAAINTQTASGNPIGLWIYGSVSSNTVKGVTFTGTSPSGICVNLDYGSNDTIQFCAFQGLFLVGGDHETFMKNTVAGSVGSVVYQSNGQANNFKLNTVTSGVVALSGSDTHQNNILSPGVAMINGGKQQGSTP
jgi:hypothetical protein